MGVVDSVFDFIAGRAGNPFALSARWTIVPTHKKFWAQRAKLDECPDGLGKIRAYVSPYISSVYQKE